LCVIMYACKQTSGSIPPPPSSARRPALIIVSIFDAVINHRFSTRDAV
jgi:hypothetical protein